MSNPKKPSAIFIAFCLAGLIAVLWPLNAFAATQPRLGTALNFTVLAGSTITNTGPTVITGNLGLSPGTSVTGFGPGVVTGTQDIADATAVQAQVDLSTGYTDAQSAPTTSDLTGQDLGGLNLTPGVYTFSSSAQLTGVLTLSGNGVFIFKIGSTLTTASNSVILLTNSAQACAVYWQVGSSATLGTTSNFQGNLMALTDITLNTGANILNGRALAQNGALTLDSNNITAPTGTCTLPAPTPTPTATPTPAPSASSTPASRSESPTPTPSAIPPGTSTIPPPTTGAFNSNTISLSLLAITLGSLTVIASRRRRTNNF